MTFPIVSVLGRIPRLLDSPHVGGRSGSVTEGEEAVFPGRHRREFPVRHQRVHAGLIAALLACVAWPGGARAGSGDSKAAESRSPSAVRPVFSHSVTGPWNIGRGPAGGWGEAEPYALPSKYYGPWEPTEIYGRDARCAPTPFAPRGYGFPKKLSPFRMDYTPYRLHDCAMESIHGPSLWWRRHRDPCCDPAFGGCRKCDPSVDPQ